MSPFAEILVSRLNGIFSLGTQSPPGQTAAMQEISGLEALEYQMTRNIEAMRERRSDAIFRSTFIGALTTWTMRAFALYCVFRFFNVSRSKPVWIMY